MDAQDNLTVCHTNCTHLNRQSPPPAAAVVVVGTAFLIIMNNPHGNMNKMKNAMLDPMKDQTTATLLMATGPHPTWQATTIIRVLP